MIFGLYRHYKGHAYLALGTVNNASDPDLRQEILYIGPRAPFIFTRYRDDFFALVGDAGLALPGGGVMMGNVKPRFARMRIWPWAKS